MRLWLNLATVAIVAAAAWCALPVSVLAQFDDQPSWKLKLGEEPELPPGKYAFVEGTADSQGHRFFLDNLSTLQPITVTLVAEDAEDDLRLQLSKYRWDEADRKGTTRGEGSVSFKLRTAGELKMLVTAGGEPRPYTLAVWVGETLEPEMKPVLIPSRNYDGERSSGGGGSTVLWVIVGLLLAVVVLLVLVLTKLRAA